MICEKLVGRVGGETAVDTTPMGLGVFLGWLPGVGFADPGLSYVTPLG